MKKKLKSWVKVTLLIIIFFAVFTLLLKIGSDRADRIDKGCMEVAEHNGGDR